MRSEYYYDTSPNVNNFIISASLSPFEAWIRDFRQRFVQQLLRHLEIKSIDVKAYWIINPIYVYFNST